MQNAKCKIECRKRGFALLIAVVISTIILTIGLTILNTALKEVVLASTVRNSLTSFYIADSGAECSLYWDNIRGNFEKKSAFAIDSPPSVIECNNITIEITPGHPFWLRNDAELNDPCAKIEFNTIPVGVAEEKVRLTSWGFNTCNVSSKRRVDRALEVKYSRFR